MQKTYSLFFDGLEAVNRELENLVKQGFKIVHFQILNITKDSTFPWKYYMAIVYEV